MRYVLGISLGLALPLGVAGCVSPPHTWRLHGWYADYEAAERDASETGRDLLLCYCDDRRGRDQGVNAALHSPELLDLTRDYVRCELFRSYEPDRRYVGQFGVDRAPALIVVRRDGTYHTTPGTTDVARIETFIADARAPGKPIKVDPYVPREAWYKWRDSLEAAETVARQTGRPLFVVFYRRLSRDWSRLSDMLQRPEVGRRLAGAVPVRIGIWGLATEATITRFGALRLPALVLDRPNGGFQKLELPRSYEQVVRFVDATFAPAKATEPSSAESLSSPTSPAPTAAAQRNLP